MKLPNFTQWLETQMPFGKYKDQEVVNLPTNYLFWALDNIDFKNLDLKVEIGQEFDNRLPTISVEQLEKYIEKGFNNPKLEKVIKQELEERLSTSTEVKSKGDFTWKSATDKAAEVGLELLGSRDSVWISVDKTSDLFDQASKAGNFSSGRFSIELPIDFEKKRDGWTLFRAPNKAGTLTRLKYSDAMARFKQRDYEGEEKELSRKFVVDFAEPLRLKRDSKEIDMPEYHRQMDELVEKIWMPELAKLKQKYGIKD